MPFPGEHSLVSPRARGEAASSTRGGAGLAVGSGERRGLRSRSQPHLGSTA